MATRRYSGAFEDALRPDVLDFNVSRAKGLGPQHIGIWRTSRMAIQGRGALRCHGWRGRSNSRRTGFGSDVCIRIHRGALDSSASLRGGASPSRTFLSKPGPASRRVASASRMRALSSIPGGHGGHPAAISARKGNMAGVSAASHAILRVASDVSASIKGLNPWQVAKRRVDQFPVKPPIARSEPPVPAEQAVDGCRQACVPRPSWLQTSKESHKHALLACSAAHGLCSARTILRRVRNE